VHASRADGCADLVDLENEHTWSTYISISKQCYAFCNRKGDYNFQIRFAGPTSTWGRSRVSSRDVCCLRRNVQNAHHCIPYKTIRLFVHNNCVRCDICMVEQMVDVARLALEPWHRRPDVSES
jgi:hypothetical protein